MNKQLAREEIQKVLQRWHQLRQQFGDQAVNVPEYVQLTKFIRVLQQSQQAALQRQQQQQGQQPDPQMPPGNGPQMGHQSSPPQQTNLPPNRMPGQMDQNFVGHQMNNGYMENTNRPSNGMNPNNMNPMLNRQMPVQNAMSPQATQYSPEGSTGNASNSGSAFTPQQFQAVKAHYQALRILLNKSAGPGSPQIPQNLVEFVTNERMAYANGNYLPAVKSGVPAQTQNQGVGVQNQIPPQPAPQHQRPPQQQNELQAAPMLTNTMGLNTVSKQKPAVPGQSPYMSPGELAKNKMLERKPSNKPKTPSQPPSRQSAVKFPTGKDGSAFKPVPLPVQMPVPFHELVPKVEENDKTIIPIDQPSVQVDCYELPVAYDEKEEDISFAAFNGNQSRFLYPDIYPQGIDMKEIKSNKEAFIILQIDEKIFDLKKQLQALDPSDIKRKEVLLAELTRLELLPYQKQLRGSFLSQVWFGKSLLPNSHPNFLAKFNTLCVDNIIDSHELYSQQLFSLVQAKNRKHQDFISEILIKSSKRRERFYVKKEKLERFTNKINSFHAQVAKEEQKKLEKMAKQRLQALKANDEEAYLKLLDHTKDTRITQLLKQTNQFLDSLAQAVQTQQREANGAADAEELSQDERREKLDYYEVAHRIKEEVSKQPSILVGGQLKEYQMKGLQWMVSLFNNHLNGILADEMGLGKTIQTISLITYLIELKKISGPFLIIVPLSTLTNWNLEFEKWAPSVRKITYKGTPTQRKVMAQDIKSGNFQILLTTFEYIIKDKSLLSRVKWVHMIIDEGHRMKNSNSKLSETLTHSYYSDNRLILTGTPLQNNLPELWALLNFVLPKIFNSVKSFDEWFNTPFANTGGQDKIELSEEETLLVIRRLHKVLRPFLLRRLKKDVEKDLPNKVEKVVKCKMSALQSKLYQQMLKFNILFAADDNGELTTIKNANNQIMQLRKICNHPFVYDEVEYMISPATNTNDQIWRVAGKFELLDRILPKFKATGHRVLIFFQMTQIMDIMEDFLIHKGLKFMRLDGGTKADDRTGLLEKFNAPGSDYFCFLLSTRAGGLGLNLQTADTVIIFDTDWNPHQDLQAQDRAHRIGQKNEVRILRLITENSIEEVILERAHAKLEIDGKVIQAGKFDNKSTAEEQEALLRALLEKEEERKTGSGDDDEDLDDDELNQVIARNDSELIVFKQLDEARSVATREAPYPGRLFTEDELPEVYKKDPEMLIKKDEYKVEDYGRGTRERKAMNYDDHLTEEQWLKQINGEVSGSDDDTDSKPKRSRARNRKPKSRPIDDFIDDDLMSQSGNGDSDNELKRVLSEDSLAENDSKRQRSVPPRPGSGNRGRGRGRGRGRMSTLNRSTPGYDPLTSEEREDLQAIGEALYLLLLNYTDDEGRRLSDLFLVKPSKKLYPDYYVLIKHPIALDTVKKRLGSKGYTQVRELLEDIHLIFSNAKIYNEEGSIVYQDAVTLENLAMQKFRELSTNLSEEQLETLLDFQEFDQNYDLKPLATSGIAVKAPIEESIVDAFVDDLDLGTDFSTPL